VLIDITPDCDIEAGVDHLIPASSRNINPDRQVSASLGPETSVDTAQRKGANLPMTNTRFRSQLDSHSAVSGYGSSPEKVLSHDLIPWKYHVSY